jgi:hypothetical protein
MKEHESIQQKCADLCSAAASAMLRKPAVVVARITASIPYWSSSHCVHHRQILLVKMIKTSLKNELDEAVKTLYPGPLMPGCLKFFVRKWAVNIKHACCTQKVGLERKVLVGVFELRSEISAFFLEVSSHGCRKWCIWQTFSQRLIN